MGNTRSTSAQNGTELQNRANETVAKSGTAALPIQPSASDSGCLDRRQPSSMDQRQRHASGPMIGVARSGSGIRNAPLSSGSLRKSGSTIMRRTGRTESTDKPFDMPTSRSNVSFNVNKADTMGSRKSMTSRATRTTVVSRAEYHEDLKPAIVAGLNKNLTGATFIIVFGSSFLFGYNIGVLNQPSKLIASFYNQTYWDRYGETSEAVVKFSMSLTTALFIPGGMIGSFLGGWLADTIGRKRTILLSHLFSISGAVISCICVVAGAPELLMLGRILVGINSGLGNCIAPMFLSEIAPFNYRGAFGTLHQLSITGGILLSSIFGIQEILGTADRWPYLILLEVVPALTSLIVLPFLPDSPRYLLLVKRERDAAADALMFYRATDDVGNDMEEMDTENQTSNASDSAAAKSESGYTLVQLFNDGLLRRPLFVACMLQIIQQFSGINAIFFFSSSIFQDANVATNHIPFAVIGTNAVNVLMTVVAVSLMDIAGRRILLLIPMLVMIIDLIILSICLILQAHYTNLTGAAYVTVACVILYVIAFAVGLGPIPMMIGAELFRQGPRPKAMAVAGVVNWIGVFAVALSFESIAEVTKPYTFVIFVVFLVAFVVFTYFLVPETKNKTFEEIANQFSPGGTVEVEATFDDEHCGNFDENDDALPASGYDDDGALVTLNFGDRSAANSSSAPTSGHDA